MYAYSFAGTGAAALESAAGVAVDNSTGPSKGALYVADFGGARVEKFDQAGNFILMFGDEVDATTGGDICTAASGDVCAAGRRAPASGAGPGTFGRPLNVAVDGSSGPSAGDVYVSDSETLQVSKFDPAGHPVTGWGEEGHLDFTSQSGIAVGPDGKLFVQSGWYTEATIFVYSQNGSPVTSFAPVHSTFGTDVAVDGSGRLYVSARPGLDRYDSSGALLGAFGDSEYGGAIATDPSDNHVYVTSPYESIKDFAGDCLSSTCDPEASFGNGYLRTYWGNSGIAAAAATHRVFAVGENRRGESEVAVFYPPGLIAAVTTLAASPVKDFTAHVSGRIDPVPGQTVSACRFEYVTEAEYRSAGYEGAQSAPCSPASQYSSAAEVSATLTGLEERTSYHYRLVASEGSATRVGGDREFRTTPALPQVETGAASNLQPESATISGSVAPGIGPRVQNCYFEYVRAANFAETGYANSAYSPCEPAQEYTVPTKVNADLDRLHPSTTYRYRLVAWSSQGFGFGEDREFRTSAEPAPPPEEEPEKPPHPGLRHVRCMSNACAHKLRASASPKTWTSPRYPTAYAWEAAVRSHGRWMPHTKLVGGCVATFRSKRLVVRLNGCGGHVKVRYVGAGAFTVVWQVFR